MGSSTSPSLNKILTIAFVINSCCLGLNLTVAKRTSLQRTLDSNFKGKHLASKLISKTDLNSVEQSVKVRTPSKRFHHFLTRTRDVFPIRRSYIKPIRNKDMKDSNLVPVIDHFAGIKAWTVPYSIRDVPTSTTETTVQDKQDWMHTLHTKTPKPTQHTETDRPVPAYSAKEALFDHEYMAYVDVARFAPEVRDAHAGVADERYSKGRWNGYHEPPGRNKPHIFSQFTHNDNSDSKENAQGKHSVQSSLGSFKAVTNSKHSSNGLDLFSFPGKGSFGKFVPDKSKSRDPPVEAGKDHEAGDTDVDDVTHNVLDGKFQPEGFFQSLGAFRNDKVNFIIFTFYSIDTQ